MKKIFSYVIVSLMAFGLVATIGTTTVSANADNDTQKLVKDSGSSDSSGSTSTSESSTDTSSTSSSTSSSDTSSSSTESTSTSTSTSDSSADVKELPQTGDNTKMIGGIALALSSVGLLVLVSRKLF